ncbi:HNH endonuclease [Heliobacillus mobilis]|uniref:HNH endonuclease n=1 Tax=Heliobacterium mobile TaxID=28064 RepID=A0A6I3SC35_HELMO|nr:HNH endonuclease domain-containing protein [Heliobacterium mobile]MTV47713.1 HNH endonuclease [Heliobacterium mobile]
MSQFVEFNPSTESYWRAIILFGRNSATYKFALAKSLLELAKKEQTFISLDELAFPFSKHLIEHLRHTEKQGTAKGGRFLDACRGFINGEVSQDQLILTTASLGFNNVLDAFHIVNQASVATKFFEVQKESRRKGIILTDELYRLKETAQFENLPMEAEARWRLVETAWANDLSTRLLEVHHDSDQELLFIRNSLRRVDITSSRDALNGYQKGKCFYCFSDISVIPGTENLCDVDHFFPWKLFAWYNDVNYDGVWNLVLSCKNCNRLDEGKFAKVPALKYVERLHRRNNFFVNSHHPLRETIMMQTGASEVQRNQFLQNQYNRARYSLISTWETTEVAEAAF